MNSRITGKDVLTTCGAAVIRNTRRIRILFAAHHPLRELFLTAARALASA